MYLLPYFMSFVRIGNTSTYYQNHTRKDGFRFRQPERGFVCSVLGESPVGNFVPSKLPQPPRRLKAQKKLLKKKRKQRRRQLRRQAALQPGFLLGREGELLVTGEKTEDTLVFVKFFFKTRWQFWSRWDMELAETTKWKLKLEVSFFQNSPLCWMVWPHERS